MQPLIDSRDQCSFNEMLQSDVAEQRDLRSVVKLEDDQGKLWDATASCAHGARPPQVRHSDC